MYVYIYIYIYIYIYVWTKRYEESVAQQKFITFERVNMAWTTYILTCENCMI